MSSANINAWSRKLDQATTITAWAASSCLILMMLIIFISVVLRYAFNAPILGSNEMIQSVSIALVMLSMPFCTHNEGHIKIDILDGAIGEKGRFFGDVLARIITLIILSFVNIRVWHKLTDAFEYSDATNMLAILVWPFYGLILFGMGFYLLIILVQLILLLMSKFYG